MRRERSFPALATLLVSPAYIAVAILLYTRIIPVLTVPHGVRILLSLSITGCLMIMHGIILHLFFKRGLLARFERMRRELGDITAQATSERRLTVDGRDEITALSQGVNLMLETLDKSNRDLRAKEERLRAVTIHLQNVQEQESQRISHRIHNDLGQLLVVLNMELSAVARAVHPDNQAACEAVQRTVALLQRTMKETQNLARHLRPRVLDELEFQAAMEWLVEDLGSRSGTMIDMKGSFDQWILSRDAVTAIFRIIQESLLNAVRHAQAKNIHIEISHQNNAMHLGIADDGKGFNAEIGREDGFGLDMIRERAESMGGMMSIMSGERGECGTRVTVCIPCSEHVRFKEVNDDANISGG